MGTRCGSSKRPLLQHSHRTEVPHTQLVVRSERCIHLQLQISDILTFFLCLCRGETQRLLVWGLKTMCFSLGLTGSAVLETTGAKVPRLDGRSAAQGSGFHSPHGVTRRGEGTQRKGCQCQLVTLPLLDTSSLLVSHRRCVHTRKSPPLTQKLVSIDSFPETHRNKRSTKPWSLGHQAEDTALQISTRQEAQNRKGNHVPFKGILIVLSFNIDVPYTSSNVRVPLSRRTGRALYITKALGGSRF